MYPNLFTRPLTAEDSTSYRQLRQKILATDESRFFSDSYEREAHLSEEQWSVWCTEKQEQCILGTFDNRELVGVIMITRQGDYSSPVVEWEVAWLAPHCRTKGIAKDFFNQARKWTQDHGYKYVAGFIRDEYTPSRDICLDMGFVHAYTIPDELWADGSIADTEALLLDLRPDGDKLASYPPAIRFKEALPFLEQGLHSPKKSNKSRFSVPVFKRA